MYVFQVCRYQPEVQKMFDFSAERTLQSVDESLKRLGLDYIDVIQVKEKDSWGIFKVEIKTNTYLMGSTFEFSSQPQV